MPNRMCDFQKTKTLSFASGKGGVGKTTVLTNVAAQLSQQGHRVLILDGDLGMANVDIMFGVRAERSIFDVISGKVSLEDVIVEVAPNISLIPGGSGIYELSHISIFQKQALLQQVSQLESKYDYLLIDTAPGIADNVIDLNAAAEEINIIITPEPTSFTDAYSLIKVLHERKREDRFSIICNRVLNEEEGLKLYSRFSEVVSRFLCVSLDYKLSIATDAEILRMNRKRQIVSLKNKNSQSAQVFKQLSEKYSESVSIREPKGGMQFFWQQMVSVA